MKSEHQRQYMKEYYRKNKEKILKYRKKYWKSYYQKNRFKIRPKTREVELRYCVRCNNPFLSKHPHKKTCSIKCSKELRIKGNKHRLKIWCAKNPKRKKQYYKKHRENLRIQLNLAIGNKCFICNSKTNLNYHEIHGKKHVARFSQILKNKENFICLCSKCHRKIHAYMRFYKLSKKEKMKIKEILNSAQNNF